MNNKLIAKIALSILVIQFLQACKKQEGCTDPTANNFSIEAEKACDNCCTYPTNTDTIANTIKITDNGLGTGTTTWTNNNVYLLEGFVFVNDGQTLTIEPGTVIKGKSGQGANASALIIAKGGKIMAEGTKELPIIFTFENDPLDGSIPISTKGQWGGIIVLGNAQLNSSPGTSQIEGIPTSESRGLYGGNNDLDNSGVLTYISIRHGGTDIGAGNEINGLTLGGVGSGTSIEFIEVIANKDDGVEFFGGTATLKHAIVSFCGDDAYDYDEGYRGKGQFWLAIQENTSGNRGGEHDGGTTPEDGAPYAHPIISNATYIGRGISSGERALTFRDNAAGEYHNSIFFNWGKGIDIENLASGEDAYERFLDGELVIKNNVFWDVNVLGTSASSSDIFKISMGDGWNSAIDSTTELNASSSNFQASFDSKNNQVLDPGLNYSFNLNGINVVPSMSVLSSPVNDSWFTTVNYVGAFESSSENWAKGWTLTGGHQPGDASSESYLQ